MSLSSIKRRELWSLANAPGGKPHSGTRSRWAGVFTLREMPQGMQRMLLLEAESVRQMAELRINLIPIVPALNSIGPGYLRDAVTMYQCATRSFPIDHEGIQLVFPFTIDVSVHTFLQVAPTGRVH